MENLHYVFLDSIMKNLDFHIYEQGHLYADQEWNFPESTAPYNRLYLILDGEASIIGEKGEIPLKKGNMYLIPMDSKYHLLCKKHMEKYYIHFNMSIIPGKDLFENIRTCMSAPLDMGKAQRIMELISRRTISDAVECQAILMGMVSDMITQVSSNLEEDMTVLMRYKELYHYLHTSCTSTTTTGQLADYLGISVHTLAKHFKRDTGYTLKNYIDKKLMQRAKQYLLLSKMRMYEIADALEFTDPFYFSKYFKRHEGVSPTTYRQQNVHDCQTIVKRA